MLAFNFWLLLGFFNPINSLIVLDTSIIRFPLFVTNQYFDLTSRVELNDRRPLKSINWSEI